VPVAADLSVPSRWAGRRSPYPGAEGRGKARLGRPFGGRARVKGSAPWFSLSEPPRASARRARGRRRKGGSRAVRRISGALIKEQKQLRRNAGVCRLVLLRGRTAPTKR
jgi:hypothetical protein